MILLLIFFHVLSHANNDLNINNDITILNVNQFDSFNERFVLKDNNLSNIYVKKLNDISVHYANSKKGIKLFDELHNQLCEFSIDHKPEAQFALAWMYENGLGVVNNSRMAEQLYRLAASNGYQLAIDMLNQYHFNLNEQVKTDQLPGCMQPKMVTSTLSENESKPVASEVIQNMAITHKKVYQLVHKMSSRYHLDPHLVLSFIATESNFDEQAISPKNAQGLMQLIPDTASRFGVKDSLNPDENIKGGMAYLEWLLAYYRGNITFVAAAYNAGEGAVDRYEGIPPYKETQLYVNKILNFYNKKTHQFRENFIKPSPLCEKGC